MSQTSGGEAGTPPASAVLGSDATTVSSSMSTGGGPCGAFPNTSSSAMQFPSTLVPDQAAGPNSSNAEPEDSREQPHQMTPSKRLNISPPPEDLFDNSCMSFQSEAALDSEQSNSIWTDDSVSNFSILSSSSYNDNTEVPRKSRKRTPRQRPGPKSLSLDSGSKDVFDADSAKGPHFVLSQLGSDSKPCPKGSATDRPSTTLQKGRILSMQYPSKREGKELSIVVQPETQHRARYLTEGSRGSVKDRTQQGFPTVKLEGVNEPVVLQVFVGNDAGRVKPHGFYQACRVTGRNTTACKEVDIEGTTVIEVPLDPSTNMTLAVDCVGVLKLRNADVEARIGVAGSKKKSTRARLVFRVNIPCPDGSILTLQTLSSPILCTQPAGLPEILKKSLHSCSVRGGEEVFIIGKNFLKDTKVVFHENISDENSWKEEAEIDMELFHQNHLIVKVPPYQNQDISSPVGVGIYVLTNAGRSHDVQPFTYTPDPAKKDVSPPADLMCQARQSVDISPCHLTNKVFPGNLPQNPADAEKQPGNVSQQFRLEPRESMRQERRCPSPGPTGRLRREVASQQQHRLPLLPLEEIEQAGDNAEQQGSPQGAVPNHGSLFQQAQQQQNGEQLLSIQTSFLQQTPSVPSPPLFHGHSSMAEACDPPGAVFHAQKSSCTQEQMQASLFPNNLAVLSGGSLAPEQQQPSASFLPQASLPSQPQQQQQMAFLNALQTSVPEPQPVFQAQAQLAPIQLGTPMEQQQAVQPQTQPPQQTFQNIPPHPTTSTLSPSQQQQAGLLFHTNPNLSNQDQPSSLLFSSQGPMPPLSSSSLSTQQSQNPALLFSQASMVPVGQQDRSEPMALGNPGQQPQQVLFSQQQPMQLGRSSDGAQQTPVSLFIPQPNMASLQGGMAAQELPPAAIFSSQNGVTTSSPPVKQPGSLFQNTVGGGAMGQPGRPQQPPGLFHFGMENECNQMMNAPGTSLSDHIIAISQSGQNQRETEAHMQSLFIQSMSGSGTIQNAMASSQSMEKMEDLLISLQQEPGNNLTHSY
ncbi:hypothetical protein NHX12_005368 [Muraenolepis orangiensis]|uniref:Nuclear factor of activated T-cells 5 n=1 Tax=Muraenolepis orangiensis TaxID=630683 RepID=A0A9Q0DTU1_9TELE|nr:hypothetical protein NHX12_005368 [Muraenolepis orangiensis]